jgi:hypothetical protein
MTQFGVVDLNELVLDEDAWLRLLVERAQTGWTLRYGQAIIGPPPATWPTESWWYDSVGFIATRLPASLFVGSLNSDSEGHLSVGDLDVIVPPAQSTGQVRHRPSFELHDRDRTPRPSFEYTLNRGNGAATTSTAGRMDYLIGPDSPSFTDLDSAYRAFFLGKYELPANESVPTELVQIRILDERAWLGPIHVRATEMTVEVAGVSPGGLTLEYFSPQSRSRQSIDGPGEITIELPEGLPNSNTWVWLTTGTSWCDYRALSGPWASDEQLQAAGVEKEQTSRDEQAGIEAVVFGGEGPFVEFKGQLPEGKTKTDRVFNTIAAFANGAGGTIVFGVDRDELTILGLGEHTDAKKERDRIGQLIRTRILPTPDFTAHEYVVDGKELIFVHVSAGSGGPYGVITDLNRRDTPQFYVRRGASTYPAQPSDLQQIVQQAVSAALTQVGSPSFPWSG